MVDLRGTAENTVRRHAAALTAVMICGAAMVGVASPPASACSLRSHCYGIAQWGVSSPSGFRGAAVTLRTKCMSLRDYAGGFITNELWVVKSRYWVEAGLTEGAPIGAAHGIFWAEKRPNGGGYHEHYSSSRFALNASYKARIRWAGGRRWNVAIGNLRGSSTRQFSAPAHTLQTGTEIASSRSPHTYGSSRSMKWFDRRGAAHTSWRSRAGRAYLSARRPVRVAWVKKHTYIRTRIGARC